MQIWIPSQAVGSGASVYFERLAKVLTDAGHSVELTHLSDWHRLYPGLLKWKKPKTAPDVIIADVITGAVFKGKSKYLIVIEHHCIFDPAYLPFKDLKQQLVHYLLWHRYEKKSLFAADKIVCVSLYTQQSVTQVFGELPIQVISNAIETDYFTPAETPNFNKVSKPVQLLYVGNLISRKGVDLLPRIMTELGTNFELRYTSGLRSNDQFSEYENMLPLGRLTREELREEYRKADIFLFPTRFEGFGYAPAEAMACGTPVVSTLSSSIPEVVEDGETGILCPVDDVPAFVAALKKLSSDRTTLTNMASKARSNAEQQFSMDNWGEKWKHLLTDIQN